MHGISPERVPEPFLEPCFLWEAIGNSHRLSIVIPQVSVLIIREGYEAGQRLPTSMEPPSGLRSVELSLRPTFAVKDRDRSKRQVRVLFRLPLQLTKVMVLSVRITERFRPYEEVLRYRTGARCDLDWSSSGLSARYGPSDKSAWKIRGRLEGLLCRSLAGLAYLEAWTENRLVQRLSSRNHIHCR